jgi:(S)-mandelate dehydrogenase
MNIRSAHNLDDVRELARRKLPRIAFDFIDGGVDDELCLRRNRDAFQQHRLLPRYLVDVSRRDQSTVLLGRRYASPFGISPTGLAGLFCPDADRLLARAAAQADIPFLLSSASNGALEDVAKVAPEHVWFQMYCTSDEKINADLVRRARECGVRVLVVSVDVPVNSNRERNKRNGFSRPFRMTAPVVLEALAHPAWVLRYLRTGGIPMMRNWQPYARAGASAADVADLYGTLTPAPMVQWSHLQRIREAWPGPLVVKGLMHPEDARQAVRLGADALVISNHGGRQLDAAPSPLEVLPAIRAAVGDDVELILDSGVRRGSDIVKALALGADMVFVGRATLFGAAAGGEPGIRRALELLRSEVERVMALLGCNSTRELGPQYLRFDSAWPGRRSQDAGMRDEGGATRSEAKSA